MPAKYVLSQKASGFHWNLVATNGRVIASSEVYNSKQAAMAGIRSVQKNGATDVIVTAEELNATRRPAKATAAKSVTKAAAKTVATGKKAAKGASSTGTAKSK